MQVRGITGVGLRPHQRLAESGLSSISLTMLVHSLQRLYPSASLDTLFLLQNPSLDEVHANEPECMPRSPIACYNEPRRCGLTMVD